MKIVTLQQAVELLIGAGARSKQKAYTISGLTKPTWHNVLGGRYRSFSAGTARRLLVAVQVIDSSVTALDCGDRIEIDPAAVRCVAFEIRKMHAEVVVLRARIRDLLFGRHRPAPVNIRFSKHDLHHD